MISSGIWPRPGSSSISSFGCCCCGGGFIAWDVDVLTNVDETIVVPVFVGGGVADTFDGSGGGRADGGLTVLHIGGWDVISHGGLGLLVVVVVVAR